VARKPDNAIWMASTEIQSVAIMQPQYRNRHNFMIFGGFLLKSTFELAFTCASAFSHTRPTFVALDPSTFENPVPVGSVLYLTATVAYTDSPLVDDPDSASKASPEGSTRIQVRVDSKIRNTEHGETKPTGQFNYTFEVKKDIKVVPQTYSQFMMYLDARRRSRRVTANVAGSSDKKESVME
jgi:acyl-coenzyme A thioesterase 9